MTNGDLDAGTPFRGCMTIRISAVNPQVPPDSTILPEDVNRIGSCNGFPMADAGT